MSLSNFTMSSSEPTPHITLSILKSYYLSVIDIRTYLNCLLQSSNLDHVQISSLESCLLNTAYVASSQLPNKSFAYFPPTFDMREVGKVLASYLNSYGDDIQIIDQAQTRLFKSKNTQNILTLGYRLVSKKFRSSPSGWLISICRHLILATAEEKGWRALG